MPVREKRRRPAGWRPACPFSGLVQAHIRGESGPFVPVAAEGTSETDWLPEGKGFEPPVPLASELIQLVCQAAWF